MEEGRAWGGRGTESKERISPSLTCLRSSVCTQQLLLCPVKCEEDPLSLTVNAHLYTQSSLNVLTSNQWTSHSHMQIVKSKSHGCQLCNTGQTLKQGLKGNFINESEIC